MGIRRWTALLAAAGLFGWMLVLFFGGSSTEESVEVRDGAADVTTASADISCASIADAANGRATDWPLDEAGERSLALSSAVDVAEAACDRVRDARGTQISLLGVPAAVLGVVGLVGFVGRTSERGDVIADAAAERAARAAASDVPRVDSVAGGAPPASQVSPAAGDDPGPRS